MGRTVGPNLGYRNSPRTRWVRSVRRENEPFDLSAAGCERRTFQQEVRNGPMDVHPMRMVWVLGLRGTDRRGMSTLRSSPRARDSRGSRTAEVRVTLAATAPSREVGRTSTRCPPPLPEAMSAGG